MSENFQNVSSVLPHKQPRHGSSGGGTGSSEPPEDDRRKRAAIAAQACETCRSRKSKCDEKRPKCGLCERIGTGCVYREPLPTKKDKTLVEMMDLLTRLEGKIDKIGHTLNSSGTHVLQPQQTEHLLEEITRSGIEMRSSQRQALEGDEYKKKNPYAHFTSPHKLLVWPSIYVYMADKSLDVEGELQQILVRGSSWFIQKELEKHSILSSKCDLESVALVGQLSPTLRDSSCRDSVTFPALSYDRTQFEEESLGHIGRHGFCYGCVDSVLVLLVLALGEVALIGSTGNRWTGCRNSGIRGGTKERPPGLSIFNEARKRIGFVATQTSLKNVQISVLMTVYYETCGRHMDCWRSAMDACLAMQVVINNESPIDWHNHRGARIKLIYHVCISLESWFRFDLNLPGTWITQMSEAVPLPGGDLELHTNDDDHRVALHFLATASLTRVISHIHEGIHQALFTSELGIPYSGPPYQVIQEMTRQLNNWRILLPPDLQWHDQDRLNFPLSDQRATIRGSRLFSSRSEDVTGNQIPSSLDIMQAHVRTRYYYAVMLINRPFLYKAIHFSEAIIEEPDKEGIVKCVQACLLWPIALYPLRDKKRLVPNLFEWTTNFMSILLLLRLVIRGGALRNIVESYIAWGELETTVISMIEWIKDMAQIDGTAEWASKIMQRLYSDVDFVLHARIFT